MSTRVAPLPEGEQPAPDRAVPADPSMREATPRPTPNGGSLSYRPALDGVRALAVLAVLVYHGMPGWSPGGFFGVDVFFVLSGYLITSLLVNEATRHHAIDLGRFWMR